MSDISKERVLDAAVLPQRPLSENHLKTIENMGGAYLGEGEYRVWGRGSSDRRIWVKNLATGLAHRIALVDLRRGHTKSFSRRHGFSIVGEPERLEVTPPATTVSRSELWADFDLYKSKYHAPKRDLNPRKEPLGIKRERRETDPTRPNATVPYHVRMGMKERSKFTCSVLGIKEGTPLRLGDQCCIVMLELDHIIPRVEGGETSPANVRMISNIANGFKLEAHLSDEQIKARYEESGYEMVAIPEQELLILKKYGVTEFILPSVDQSGDQADGK